MQKPTRRWLKAAVVTFGVVDCVGIYIAHDRLSRPASIEGGSDLAYAVPAPERAFRPERQLADAAPVRLAADPTDVPHAATAAPQFVPAPQELAVLRADPAAADDGQTLAAGPTRLSGLVATRVHAPLFAAAFDSGCPTRRADHRAAARGPGT